LFSLLGDKAIGFKRALEQYGFFFLLLLIFLIPGGINWIFNLASQAVYLFSGQLLF